MIAHNHIHGHAHSRRTECVRGMKTAASSCLPLSVPPSLSLTPSGPCGTGVQRQVVGTVRMPVGLAHVHAALEVEAASRLRRGCTLPPQAWSLICFVIGNSSSKLKCWQVKANCGLMPSEKRRKGDASVASVVSINFGHLIKSCVLPLMQPVLPCTSF